MLGILGVSMPLLYGEGDVAFIRLQEELIKHSDDQTLLAWNTSNLDEAEDSDLRGEENKTKEEKNEKKEGKGAPSAEQFYEGIFAKSPAAFSGCSNLIPRQGNHKATPFAVTNKGLTIEAPFCPAKVNCYYLMLLCGPKDDPTSMIALPLWHVQGKQYARGMGQPVKITYGNWAYWLPQTIHLLVQPPSPTLDGDLEKGGIWIRRIPDGFHLGEAFPPDRWSPRNGFLGKTVSRGIMNALGTMPSFVIHPPGSQDDLPSVRVTLEAMLLPRNVTRALGVSPFRASCSAIPTTSTVKNTSSADQPTSVRLQTRGSSYVRIPDGSLLYITMSLHTVLETDILVIDVMVTRYRAQKAWQLLRHYCADCLARPLSFPTSLPAIASCLDFLEYIALLTTLAVLTFCLGAVICRVLASGSIRSFMSLSDGLSLLARSTVKNLALSAYFALTRTNRYNNVIGPFAHIYLQVVARLSWLSPLRRLRLLPLGTWAITSIILDLYPEHWLLCPVLWIASCVYFMTSVIMPEKALPQGRQAPDRNHQALADESWSFIKMNIGFHIFMVCLFFLFPRSEKRMEVGRLEAE